MKNPNEKSSLWSSLGELTAALLNGYSVTDDLRKQYEEQVKQYPLYPVWFEKVIGCLDAEEHKVRVTEYGPGIGILAEKLVSHPKVAEYVAIEPDEKFAEKTREVTGNKAKIIKSTAEEYVNPNSTDRIILTASYHHFSDKPRALKNIYTNLMNGGEVIMGEVFLPHYEYDENYDPVDKRVFVQSVLKYAAAQIKAMPSPREEDIADQISTAILDMARIEEKKVCESIVREQLKRTGFSYINIERMEGNNPAVNYDPLGYRFVTARKA